MHGRFYFEHIKLLELITKLGVRLCFKEQMQILLDIIHREIKKKYMPEKLKCQGN